MRFLHTMLRVGDLDRSIRFYTDVMGMTLLRRSENTNEQDCSQDSFQSATPTAGGEREGPLSGPSGARKGQCEATLAGYDDG